MHHHFRVIKTMVTVQDWDHVGMTWCSGQRWVAQSWEHVCCRCGLLAQIWPTTGNGQILLSMTMWGIWCIKILNDHFPIPIWFHLCRWNRWGTSWVARMETKLLWAWSWYTELVRTVTAMMILMMLARWDTLWGNWVRGWRRLFSRSTSRERRSTGWGWLLQESSSSKLL